MGVLGDSNHLSFGNDETLSLLLRHHKEPVWKQYLAASTASIISLAMGCVLGWSSSALPILMTGQAKDLGGIERISTEEASWVSSLVTLGSLVSAISAGRLTFYYGRKRFLMMLGILLIFGWVFIIWNGNNVGLIYLGRFLCGFAGGSTCVPLPMYTNEICCDVIRGRSGVLYDMMQVLGILFVYSASAVTTLYWTSIICMTVPICFLGVFYWMPESPLFLIKSGKQAEAVEALRWLHGEQCNIENELMKIRLALLEGKKNILEDDEYSSLWESISEFFNNLNETVFKSFTLVFFLFLVQRSCGASMVTAYGVDVFQATRVNIHPQTATVFAGVSQLVFSALSVALVDRLGRKILLAISLFTMAICSSIYVIYMIFLSKGYSIEDEFGWIPVLGVCLFVGVYRLGVGPIPWFLGVELIPTEAQQWTLPVIYFTGWTVSFIWNKSYLAAVASFGYGTVFGVFTVICILGLLHTFIIPETRNKSRLEIQLALGASIPQYIEIDKTHGSVIGT